MNEKGITNAAALVGGTQAWEKAGFPMESSEDKSTQNKNANAAAPQQNSASGKEKKPNDH